MQAIVNAPAAAAAMALAAVVGAGSAAAQPPSPLLATIRAGDVAALAHAIEADLQRHVAGPNDPGRPLTQFSLRLDEAVCHEAEPVWVDIPPVGVCLVQVSAWQVGASYALIVSAHAPVGFALLDYAIE